MEQSVLHCVRVRFGTKEQIKEKLEAIKEEGIKQIHQQTLFPVFDGFPGPNFDVSGLSFLFAFPLILFLRMVSRNPRWSIHRRGFHSDFMVVYGSQPGVLIECINMGDFGGYNSIRIPESLLMLSCTKTGSNPKSNSSKSRTKLV